MAFQQAPPWWREDAGGGGLWDDWRPYSDDAYWGGTSFGGSSPPVNGDLSFRPYNPGSVGNRPPGMPRPPSVPNTRPFDPSASVAQSQNAFGAGEASSDVTPEEQSIRDLFLELSTSGLDPRLLSTEISNINQRGAASERAAEADFARRGLIGSRQAPALQAAIREGTAARARGAEVDFRDEEEARRRTDMALLLQLMGQDLSRDQLEEMARQYNTNRSDRRSGGDELLWNVGLNYGLQAFDNYLGRRFPKYFGGGGGDQTAGIDVGTDDASTAGLFDYDPEELGIPSGPGGYRQGGY